MLKAISVIAKRFLKRQNPRSTRPQRVKLVSQMLDTSMTLCWPKSLKISIKTRTLVRILISNLLTLSTNVGLLNLANPKMTEKMKTTVGQETATSFIVARVNTEIWDKLDNKTRRQDFRASSIQKSMVKVGAILALSTETLVQLRQKKTAGGW